MVTDRRSGSGGKANGAPPHLPTPPAGASRISEDDRAFLEAGYAAAENGERRFAEGMEARGQGLASRAFAVKHVWKKYGLADGDAVDYKTGEIKRGSVAGDSKHELKQ